LRLATPEVSTATGGSQRIETTRAMLASRLTDPVAPVSQRALALIGATMEQGKAMLAFLRSDPKGFDLAGYCTALDQATKAVSFWGKVLGDTPYDLFPHNSATRLLLMAP